MSADAIHINVPEHLKIFSQAIRPSINKISRTIDAMANPAFTGNNGRDSMEGLYRRTQASINNLADLVNTMMAEVVSNPAVPAATIHAHVGRYENNLYQLLDTCNQAVHCSDQGYPEIKALLLSGFSRQLGQILDWQQSLCNALDDPMSAYQNKPGSVNGGAVVFSCILNLTYPPEFEALDKLSII